MRMLSLEEIVSECESSGGYVLFVDFDKEHDALIYELVKPLPDGGTESEMILYNGDMDEILFALKGDDPDPGDVEVEYVGYSDGSGDFSTATITLRLNGLEAVFGDNGCDYPRFWVCLGLIDGSEKKDAWVVIDELLPAFLQDQADEIENMLKENIPCFNFPSLL